MMEVSLRELSKELFLSHWMQNKLVIWWNYLRILHLARKPFLWIY